MIRIRGELINGKLKGLLTYAEHPALSKENYRELVNDAGGKWIPNEHAYRVPGGQLKVILNYCIGLGIPIVPHDNFMDLLRKEIKDCKNLRKKISERVDALDLKKFNRNEHQLTAINWLATKQRAIIGDAPGLGKSIIGYGAAIARGHSVILIIGPAAAYDTWKDHAKDLGIEFKRGIGDTVKPYRFEFRPGAYFLSQDSLPPTPIQIQIAKGQIKKNKATKENLREAEQDSSWINQLPEGVCLIIDEAHNFRNPKTIRSKRLQYISDTLQSRKGSIWPLTGTLWVNKFYELWSMLQLAGIGTEAFGTRDGLLTSVGGEKNEYGTWEIPDTIDEKIPEILSPYVLRRTNEEAGFPAKFTYINHFIPLPKDDEILKVLDDQQKLWESANYDPSQVLQIIGESKLEFSKISRGRKLLALAKIPAMLKLIKELGAPLVVASCNLPPIHALAKEPKMGIIIGGISRRARKKIVDDFRNEILDVVGISIQAGGVAINLERATRMVITDFSWTPGEMWQAERRICRLTSKIREFEYHLLKFNHPIENRVHEVIKLKTQQFDQSLKGLGIPVWEEEIWESLFWLLHQEELPKENKNKFKLVVNSATI